MAPSNLRQLLRILTEQVNIIEDLAERRGVPGYPSLIERPTEEQNRFIADTAVVRAAYLANSAASQLAATLRSSGLLLYDRAASVGRFLPEIVYDPLLNRLTELHR